MFKAGPRLPMQNASQARNLTVAFTEEEIMEFKLLIPKLSAQRR